MSLQFQDRVNQTLSQVRKNVESLVLEIKEIENNADKEFNIDLMDWKHKMEHNYATSEQRLAHHGKVVEAESDEISYF